MDPQFIERRRYPRARIEWPVDITTDQAISRWVTLADNTAKELTLPSIGVEIINIADRDRRLVAAAVSKPLKHDNGVPTQAQVARVSLEKLPGDCRKVDLRAKKR